MLSILNLFISFFFLFCLILNIQSNIQPPQQFHYQEQQPTLHTHLSTVTDSPQSTNPGALQSAFRTLVGAVFTQQQPPGPTPAVAATAQASPSPTASLPKVYLGQHVSRTASVPAETDALRLQSTVLAVIVFLFLPVTLAFALRRLLQRAMTLPSHRKRSQKGRPQRKTKAKSKERVGKEQRPESPSTTPPPWPTDPTEVRLAWEYLLPGAYDGPGAGGGRKTISPRETPLPPSPAASEQNSRDVKDDSDDAMQIDSPPRPYRPHLHRRRRIQVTTCHDRSGEKDIWYTEWGWPPSSPSSASTSCSSEFESITHSSVNLLQDPVSAPEPHDPTGEAILATDLPTPHRKLRTETRRMRRNSGGDIVIDTTWECPRTYRAEDLLTVKEKQKQQGRKKMSVEQKEERLRRGSWKNVFGPRATKIDTEAQSEKVNDATQEAWAAAAEGPEEIEAAEAERIRAIRAALAARKAPVHVESMNLDRVQDSDSEKCQLVGSAPSIDNYTSIDQPGPSTRSRKRKSDRQDLNEQESSEATTRKRFSARLRGKGFRRFVE